MQHYSFRPALTFQGRTFLGPRGFSGKALHPPLSDVPLGACMIVAGLDLITFLGSHAAWQSEFYQAATFNLVAATAVALGATYAGTLVFGYGFNVGTAGDHAAWHHSEIDVFPGKPAPVAAPWNAST